MVSKQLMKLIRSLEMKKNRLREGLFVAEGPKVVGDLMRFYEPVKLIATRRWEGFDAAAARTGGSSGGQTGASSPVLIEATDDELRRSSFLQHPQQVIGLFRLPPQTAPSADVPRSRLCLALDGVQDPGNVGTILRIADWFGITTVYCSQDTADIFNPKVVQATMGSIARVQVVTVDLPAFLDSLGSDVPVYGTLLDGTDIYRQELSATGVIVMGNEGRGLSEAVRSRINRRLYIPAWSEATGAESLNVAIATAVVAAEFRRRMSMG